MSGGVGKAYIQKAPGRGGEEHNQTPCTSPCSFYRLETSILFENPIHIGMHIPAKDIHTKPCCLIWIWHAGLTCCDSWLPARLVQSVSGYPEEGGSSLPALGYTPRVSPGPLWAEENTKKDY